MIVRIRPGKAGGSITAPPSKSMAHRLLLSAALSDQESRIENLALSEDILATIDCLQALGKQISVKNGRAVLSGPGILKDAGIASESLSAGNGGKKTESLPEVPIQLPVRESGSTLRFLIPCALTSGRAVLFTGAKRLFSRPLSVYETIAQEQDFLFRRTEDSLLVKGRLKPGNYTIPGNISSQFISGMLFALPGLCGDSRLEIIPPVESRPYIDMTMAALQSFGIDTRWSGTNTIEIPGKQAGTARNLSTEGDYSNAAFLEILNVFGGNTEISGLNPDSLQGDRVYRKLFSQLISGFPTIDLTDCPDLGPVLFAAAAALHGGKFTGTARLRIKESDRCAAMQEELRKFGILCENEEDSFTVLPGKIRTPSELLYGHNDHRIVMALSSLCTLTGGEISGAEAVRKSWPGYFETIGKLGIEVENDAVDQ